MGGCVALSAIPNQSKAGERAMAASLRIAAQAQTRAFTAK